MWFVITTSRSDHLKLGEIFDIRHYIAYLQIFSVLFDGIMKTDICMSVIAFYASAYNVLNDFFSLWCKKE